MQCEVSMRDSRYTCQEGQNHQRLPIPDSIIPNPNSNILLATSDTHFQQLVHRELKPVIVVISPDWDLSLFHRVARVVHNTSSVVIGACATDIPNTTLAYTFHGRTLPLLVRVVRGLVQRFLPLPMAASDQLLKAFIESPHQWRNVGNSLNTG